MRDDLPTGTVTFLFTDVEGSTRLLRELGAEAYAEALAEHRRVDPRGVRRRGRRRGGHAGRRLLLRLPDRAGSARRSLRRSPRRSPRARSRCASACTRGRRSSPTRATSETTCTSPPGSPRRATVGRSCSRRRRASSSTALAHRPRRAPPEGHRAARSPSSSSATRRFPPLKTISNTNLPRPASSFVGREAELEEVLARIEEGARLVTLTGPGGSGKTRLALEAAATLVPEYKAGVFWVGLAALRDPALVTETIAQTLGAKDGLAEHIGEREMLLLLDNLEQVIEAAPELSALLQACPNLTLLVTSRELLRVQGEVEYAVPPLAEPEAVSLFCERSQLEPSDEIAELCAPPRRPPARGRARRRPHEGALARADPRAPLAAPRPAQGRPRRRSPPADAAGDDRVELRPPLRRGAAALPPASPSSPAAARSRPPRRSATPTSTPCSRSSRRASSASPNERYWMLETIREYATGRLGESGEIGDLRRRHAEHLVAFAEAMEPELLGPDPARALARVHADIDNIRAASGWARDTTQSALELRLAYGLRHYWTDRGYVGVGDPRGLPNPPRRLTRRNPPLRAVVDRADRAAPVLTLQHRRDSLVHRDHGRGAGDQAALVRPEDARAGPGSRSAVPVSRNSSCES